MATGDNYPSFVPAEEELITHESPERQEKELTLEEVRAKILAEEGITLEQHISNITQRHSPFSHEKDSVIRLEEEQKIFEELEKSKPVIIRGPTQTGKTSILLALQKRYKNSIKIDQMSDSRRLGLFNVVGFISKRENRGNDEIEKEIKESGSTPMEYLENYLKERDEICLLEIDEIAKLLHLVNHEDILKAIGNLKNSSVFRVVLVFHIFGAKEKQQLIEALGDYNSNYSIFDLRDSITLDEVFKLIKKNLEGTYITLTDRAIQLIFTETKGVPIYINFFLDLFLREISSYDEVNQLKYDHNDIFTYLRLFQDNLPNNHFIRKR